MSVKYIQNKKIHTTEFEDSLMMMSIEAGKYFELNPVSRRIWELLAEPHTQDEIIAKLLEEFEVSEEECRTDVTEHLELLKNKKILLVEK